MARVLFKLTISVLILAMGAARLTMPSVSAVGFQRVQSAVSSRDALITMIGCAVLAIAVWCIDFGGPELTLGRARRR